MENRFVGPGKVAPSMTTRPPVKYFESNGNLREALVDTEAEEVARQLAEDGLNTSQIRAYFFEVLSLRRRVDLEIGDAAEAVGQEIFLKHRPELKMLRAKVHYARARGTIKDRMKFFIEDHARAVVTLKDFRAFCTHFEAVVAFHRGLGKKG